MIWVSKEMICQYVGWGEFAIPNIIVGDTIKIFS